MLKIFLWRSIYNYFCFLKLIGFRGAKVHYFAFGANLDPTVLKGRNIIPYSRTQFVLKNFAIRFNHEIPFKDAAMASIEPSSQENITGVIYEIDKIDERRLDCMESHIIFNRYGKKYGKDEVGNSFFFYSSNCPKDGLSPTAAYLKKILNGYELIDPKPTQFIEKLSRIKTIDGFHPKDPPNFLVKNYNQFGMRLRSTLIWYDKKCVSVFASLIFKPSLFEKYF